MWVCQVVKSRVGRLLGKADSSFQNNFIQCKHVNTVASTQKDDIPRQTPGQRSFFIDIKMSNFDCVIAYRLARVIFLSKIIYF